jgi:hypothetical protein
MKEYGLLRSFGEAIDNILNLMSLYMFHVFALPDLLGDVAFLLARKLVTCQVFLFDLLPEDELTATLFHSLVIPIF